MAVERLVSTDEEGRVLRVGDTVYVDGSRVAGRYGIEQEIRSEAWVIEQQRERLLACAEQISELMGNIRWLRKHLCESLGIPYEKLQKEMHGELRVRG